MSIPRLKIVLALFACLTAAGLIGALALSSGGADALASRAAPASGRSAAPGTPARFAFLARQTSNSCGLEPAVLMRMPDHMRLQGSCCTRMDLAAYRSQVRDLRAYRGISQIPRDPYDVPVSLAKRLLSYDRMVPLSPGQARTYARAMRMSHEKGPCCCHCWRWDAFRGLSRYLIADRDWTAARVAAVIDLVEGCGGPVDA